MIWTRNVVTLSCRLHGKGIFLVVHGRLGILLKQMTELCWIWKLTLWKHIPLHEARMTRTNPAKQRCTKKTTKPTNELLRASRCDVARRSHNEHKRITGCRCSTLNQCMDYLINSTMVVKRWALWHSSVGNSKLARRKRKGPRIVHSRFCNHFAGKVRISRSRTFIEVSIDPCGRHFVG